MPPQSGPQPFVYTNQAPPNSQQGPYPTNDPRNRTSSGNQPPPTSDPYQHHRPQSTFDNPQELSTTSYTSPISDGQNQGYPPHMPPQVQHSDAGYSPSIYSPTDNEGHQHYGQAIPPTQYGGASTAPPPQQPSHQPPYPSAPPQTRPPQEQSPPPSHPPPQPASPSQGGNAYAPINNGPPGPTYQPYKPQQYPGYTADTAANPNDYYR